MRYLPIFAGFTSILSPHGVQAAIVHWDNGAIDNVAWHVPENWANDVAPGTAVGDKIILNDTIDSAYVTQAVNPLNPTDITIRANARLTIAADLSNIDDFLLGPNTGLDGGAVVHSAGTLVANKLSVGNNPNATSASTYEIAGEAVLQTSDTLTAKLGTLIINGDAATVSAGSNLDLSQGGNLKFVLGEYGVTAVDVTNSLLVNSTDSTLTVDGSFYRGGSGTIELAHYSNISGSFAAENIILTGFKANQSASITHTATSILLSVSTDVVADNDSKLWFSMTPNAGSAAESVDDLYMSNEHHESTLGSPYMTCNRWMNGDDMHYTITWTGNDFNADGTADTLSFDVLVMAYEGATYAYSEESGESSVTELGTNAAVSENNGRWGVGTDVDLDAGEALRFIVVDTNVSVPGYEVELGDFTAFGLNEIGGHSHKHIRGVGAGLDSAEINFPTDYAFEGMTPLVVASAGSGTNFGFQLDYVNFSLRVHNPSEEPVWNVSDYSFSPDGIGYVEPYPAQTGNVSFPNFSWESVPLWLAVRNQSDYGQSQIDDIANNYQLVMLEKSNQNGLTYTDDGIFKMAANLKAVSPDIKILAYWNSGLFYGDFSASETYDLANWSETEVDVDGNVSYVLQRGSVYRFEHSLADLRDWWVDFGLSMAEDSNIDGLFIDVPGFDHPHFYDEAGVPTTDRASMFDALRSEMPADKMLVGNSLRSEHLNGGRHLMECFDGSYLERWDFIDRETVYEQTEADVFVNSIQLMREALSLGKMINLQSGPEGHGIEDDPAPAGSVNTEARKAYAQKWVDFPLAVYLITAEDNAFFGYNMGVNAIEESFNDDVWSCSYIDQLNRPLGEPLADPTRDGYVFTRSYTHADVWLDVSSKKANILWKNDLGSPTHAGSAISTSDGTYVIEGGGADIWNRSDQGFYLSDSFTEDAELVARVDSVENTNQWAKAGVMFRESLDADAANVMVLVRPDKQVNMQWRTASGAISQSSGLVGDTSNAKWVKLVRSGDVFTGYYSTDGSTWIQINSQAISMDATVEGGLAVTSHNDATLSTATFTDVSMQE